MLMKFYLSIFIIFLTTGGIYSNLKKQTNLANFSSGKIIGVQTVSDSFIINKFIEKDAIKYAKYSHLVNCSYKPLDKSITNSSDKYKFYYYFLTSREDKFHYKIMIHYNDVEKKILVSFAAPNDNNYIQEKVYNNFSFVKKYKFKIEKELAFVYFKKIRPILLKKIKNLERSKRNDFSYIFTGFGLGASISILAAYDILQTEKRYKKDLIVYAFGNMRIGDLNFINYINNESRLYVWKIYNINDFIYRFPICSVNKNNWKCMNKKEITFEINSRCGAMSSKIVTNIINSKQVKCNNFKQYLENYFVDNVVSTQNNTKTDKDILGMLRFKQNEKDYSVDSNISLVKQTSNTNKTLENNKANYHVLLDSIYEENFNQNLLISEIKNALQTNTETKVNLIYYSQNFGDSIYYNFDETNRFKNTVDSSQLLFTKVCTFSKNNNLDPINANVNLCEKSIKIPVSSYITNSHLNYFNFDFSNCSLKSCNVK